MRNSIQNQEPTPFQNQEPTPFKNRPLSTLSDPFHYLPGEHLLGDDGEGTTDGSHPNDLGFQRQAEAFSSALAPLLTPGR